MNLRPYCLAGLLIAHLACGPAHADDPVLARIDGDSITAGQFRALLKTADPATLKRGATDPSALLGLLRVELGRRAILQEAQREHWAAQPEIAARIERARADAIVDSWLETKAAQGAVAPTQAAAESVYKADLQQFMQPRAYRLAQIYVAMPQASSPEAIAAARARAEDLARQARNPASDFGALARGQSDDKASAPQGGDLGWTPESGLIPAVAAVVPGLAAGETSDAIQAGDGWHIVKEIATRPAAPRPFAEVKEAIYAALRREAQIESAQNLVNRMLARKQASVNMAVLKTVMAGLGK